MAAIRGRIDVVVLRIKDRPTQEVIQRGRAAREACAAGGVPFVVSHCLEAARALNADGFHTGVNGPSISAAWKELGLGVAIGYSAHSPDEVHEAAVAGANYVFIGPVYATPSKAAFGEPIGTEPLAVASGCGIPIIAIGGIDQHRVAEVAGAGCTGVAVIRAICAAPDAQLATVQLKQAISAVICPSCE
jgi:thiamine-phosphate pyrophosphorylase